MHFTLKRDRRGPHRYAIVATMPLNGSGVVQSMNLSSSGIYFRTDQPFAGGQEISLTLPFTHAGPPGTRVRCAARVVRVERLENGYGVAATYEPIAFEHDEAAARTAALHPDA